MMLVMRYAATTRLVLFWAGMTGCTVGQTGEERSFSECSEKTSSIDVDEVTAIGIEPAAYFDALQSSSPVSGDVIEVTFAQLFGADFVETLPEGIAGPSDCPDFVTMEVTLELRSVDSQLFAETLTATMRVFGDGSGLLNASLPRDEIQGEFGADDVTPSGQSFDRIALQLELAAGEIINLHLSAESDDQDRIPESIVAWP